MTKIIICDDESIIRKGQRKLISDNFPNIEIFEAKNGEELIALIIKYHPDLVITDIKMPKIDGLEAIKKIRDLNIDVNFIIISGYELFSYAKKAIEYGVNAYLLKPFDNEEFIDKIKQIIPDNKEKFNYMDMISYINEHYNDPDLNLSKMERVFSRGRTSINDYFKEHLDMTPIEYINFLKVEKAKFYLLNSNMKIVEIAQTLNFTNQHYFSKVFKEYTSYTPTQFKELKTSLDDLDTIQK